MNKEQFEKELGEKLASLKEEMMQKFEEEKEDEFPKIGEYYWYITDDGVVVDDTWADDDIDNDRLSIGNRFKTEEKAEFDRERRKVLHEMEKYAEPEDREWNLSQSHWTYRYDFSRKKIDYDWLRSVKYSGIYFESIEKAKEALESVGEERVKKYYLGVEEND